MARSASSLLDFLSPISLVPGMGPKRCAALNAAGVFTIGDLLYRFPRRYLDRSHVVPVNELSESEKTSVTVMGFIESVHLERGRKPKLRAVLNDASGILELLFFHGVTFYRQSIRAGLSVIATGKVTRYGKLQMVHPEVEVVAAATGKPAVPILPRYGLTDEMREAGAGQRFLFKGITWVLSNLKHYPKTLPEFFEAKKKFPPLEECLKKIHLPEQLEEVNSFRMRIEYEELYKTAFAQLLCRQRFQQPGRPLGAGTYYAKFRGKLPFELTKDQSGVVAELHAKASSPLRMHCLLQGDVGSGKTIAAFCAALPALEAGLQVIWMAPTEILARQTWDKVTVWLEQFNLSGDLFTAALHESGEYATVKSRVLSGKSRFVVGTHALLNEDVRCARIGMIIVDEQHRFGAEQRLKLQEKDVKADYLQISATPIPQALAQTIYGDLDIVTIRALPPGRQPVSTHLVADDKRSDMEHFIAKQLEGGAQYYHVVPRIEDDADEDESDRIADVKTAFKKISSGILGKFAAGFLHGRLPAIEKQAVLAAFCRKEIAILVATSVIEVGIDVPDATVIVIENCERFGLAQLHQLRGRVGRGTQKSYCFLMFSKELNPDSIHRLKEFCKENDGFNVAELDLKNRGPGEVGGFAQTGADGLQWADILKDAELYREISNDIRQQFKSI